MPLDWKAPAGLLGDRQNVPAVFETIYQKNIWRGGSGPGSTTQAAGPYMALLQAFIKSNQIRSIVDIGCGDWQFSQLIDWGGRTYLGIDVVASVIESNRQQFAKPNIAFTHANPLEDGFSAGGDLLLMKDVLQHLSNANAQKLLRLTSQFKFSLITNSFVAVNDDCENGDTRPLDIRAAPFNIHHAAMIYAYAEKAVFLVVTPGSK